MFESGCISLYKFFQSCPGCELKFTRAAALHHSALLEESTLSSDHLLHSRFCITCPSGDIHVVVFRMTCRIPSSGFMFFVESPDFGCGFTIGATNALRRLPQSKRLRKVSDVEIPDVEHVFFVSGMGCISPHVRQKGFPREFGML